MPVPAQAYEHHCIAQLPPAARQLRDAAAYMVANSLVVQWALEVYGFREVSIKARARRMSSSSPAEGFVSGYPARLSASAG